MSITQQEFLARCISKQEILIEDLTAIIEDLLDGRASMSMLSAIVTSLASRGLTITEQAAISERYRQRVVKVCIPDQNDLVDYIGSGGDRANTFNISTASTFVMAAAGLRVAKTGGRAGSSHSGSADVLKLLGAEINLSAEDIARSIRHTRIGFMNAANHLPRMNKLRAVQKDLGLKTFLYTAALFANPMNAPTTFMGLSDPNQVQGTAEILRLVGSRRAVVVHGEDGLDEVSISASTQVAELKDDRIRNYQINPREFGMELCSRSALVALDPENSKNKVLSALSGDVGPLLNIVAINAGVGLYAADMATSIGDGIDLAKASIFSGAARAKLEEFVSFTKTVRTPDPLREPVLHRA